MNNPKLIIFDLDGTLVDAYPAIIKSFNYVMRRFGYPAQDPLTIRRAVGWGDEFLVSPFVKKADLKKMLAAYREHHTAALVKYSRVFPHARTLLRHLVAQGYVLAVASNRPTKFSLILMRHLGVYQFFDYVLCGDRMLHGKPHPEILQRIMKKFSVSPKETMYVGDMNIDAQAGRRARVKTIIVTTGSSSLAEIKKEKPYRIIRCVADASKIIRALTLC